MGWMTDLKSVDLVADFHGSMILVFESVGLEGARPRNYCGSDGDVAFQILLEWTFGHTANPSTV